ncbi:EAL domain, c-di-GMP-specific phosphodiesterase class I (or its enzymatically inactive variant) [Onishia taeanensis]|uniref:EAL domain, c-di-GMP-specific phosphodiesterase class I (Or its enzymatically inactive variant) n=1 Tax=Onishia taeanensis TaxID=284577 RepID=A0A1G7Q0V9_9GAMM|nr:LapD/MoxY N-terminal periplasmic domain-containing protein [Halomonas taeanensis]SDF92146.1 EAL domain, c-di-GMP-specific phosphodiesterase class I (or its enzymatically inactive variant) [Halomonas taeanensis]
MSLITKLWLSIAAVLLLAFGGSLIVGLSTSRHYIEQEVRIKNEDNANALALSMSQLDKDPVTIELLLSAQFDTGHYQRIELRDPGGDLILRREASPSIGDVPGWFVDLVRISVPAGSAVVQDGWRQYGTLTLQSQHSYAYRSLWRSSQQLVTWFAFAALISMLIAWLLVLQIRRPLSAVIAQANDIGNRRFTTSPEPKTRELRDLVMAMNRLSGSVRQMLTRESGQLEELRRKLQQDETTGIANRSYFMTRLGYVLESDEELHHGCLALVRVSDLEGLNEGMGRPETDRFLHDLASTLHQYALEYPGSQAGRLNGSDFALLLPNSLSADDVADQLKRRLHPIADRQPVLLNLPIGIVGISRQETRDVILSRLDGELAKAELRGGRTVCVANQHTGHLLFSTHSEWRNALNAALAHGVQLARYPVMDANGSLLHEECPSRLWLAGEWQPAGAYLGWISRFGMDDALDLASITSALKCLEREETPLALNLTSRAISSTDFRQRLIALLSAYPREAKRLWLELPESVAVHHMEDFKSLCHDLRRFECRIGLEHVGQQFTHLADLQDSGLSYLKFDTSLTKGVDHQSAQQTLLRGMATLSHSLGILAIAEGVSTPEEHRVLLELGMDGVTGTAVKIED